MMRSSFESRIFMVLLLSICAVNGLVLTLLAPMWSGPDEYPHYGYVQHLWRKGTLPDQRDCFLSQEIMESVYEADWWRVAKKGGKVAEGPEQFYTNGFLTLGDAGECSLAGERVHGGKQSLCLDYTFTEKEDEAIGIRRDKVDISGCDAIGLWAASDDTEVSLLVRVKTEGLGDSSRTVPIGSAGYEEVRLALGGNKGKRSTTGLTEATLEIAVTDSLSPHTRQSGSVFLDDIWLERGGVKTPLTGFERSELPVSDGDAINWVAHHPPLYYLLLVPLDAAFSGLPVFTRAFVCRVSSVAFSVITVFMVCLISQAVFGRKKLHWVLPPSLIVFSPTFSLHQAYINNDHLLFVLYTLMLLLMVKWVGEPITARRAVILGGVLGLGLITKLLMVTAIPLLPIFFLLTGRRNLKTRVKASVKWSFLSYVCAFAVSGWWFIRNFFVYGQPMITLTTIWPDPKWPVEMTLWDFFISKNFLFWNEMSWFVGRPNELEFLLTSIALDLGAAGLLWLLVLTLFRRKTGLPSQSYAKVRVLLFAVIVHALVIWSQVSAGSINVGHFRALQGRYFLPVIAGISVIWALGVSRLVPSKFNRPFIAAVVALIMAIEFSNVYVTTMTGWYPF